MSTRDTLRRLADAATPGPWESDGRHVAQGPYHPDGVVMIARLFDIDGYTGQHDQVVSPERDANGAFIAAAREMVPELISLLDKAEGMLVALVWRCETEQMAHECDGHDDEDQEPLVKRARALLERLKEET